MTEDKKIRVLVVDDEQDIVEVTRGCLDSRGFITEGATSGQEALDLIKTSPPDVLLLDISMPGMDGVDVIQILRADENTRRLPIIILSALVDADNVIKCFDEGADDYVIKPPDFTELAARLRRHALSSRNAAVIKIPAGDAADKSRQDDTQKNLEAIEAALKQISLAIKLAKEKHSYEFQAQCLERIEGFCSFAMNVIGQTKDINNLG